MDAILLVAGYATRLYPLTINTPKPLLPVGGRAMIDYITDELLTLPELNHIYLVSNHRFAEHFEHWAESFRIAHPEVNLSVLDDGTVDNATRLGAIGDIQFVVGSQGLCDDLVVVAGDNLFTYRMRHMYDFFKKVNKDTLVAVRVDDVDQLRKLAVATLAEDGRILEMTEKPDEPKSNTALYATYFYRKETLPRIKEYLDEGNTPDAPGNFPAWLSKTQDIYAYRAEGTCIDIGTPENYKEVCDNFESLWQSRTPL